MSVLIYYSGFTNHAGADMPRVSKAQAAQNRVTILDASARLFRERGIDGVSVADLMADAGLTHGGFYGHFDSKEALAAEACAHAFAQSGERRRKRIAGFPAGADALALHAGVYLSARNVEAPGHGCPAVGLASDVARLPQDAPARAAYAEGLEDMLEDFMDMATGNLSREQALLRLATLVGAVTLARGTAGLPLSEEVLAAVRTALAVPQSSLGG
jgi:TetR/AcrR family transcriptional repressor of nem operon